MADFLGEGWAFPVRIHGGGGFSMAGGRDAIAQSIWIILSTAPGERVMRPEFGCRIHEYLHAPNNASTQGAVAHFAREALTRWEPRIQVTEVQPAVDPAEPSLIELKIAYRVRSNNAFHNLVYPFFLNE
jgi:uncharacterized protein